MQITVNISMTADGKAGFPGRLNLQRIGNERDKERMRELRRESDAIVIGGGTILADNVGLRCGKEFRRVIEGREYPLRAAVIGKTIPSPDSNIFERGIGGDTIIFCGAGNYSEMRKKLQDFPALECGNGYVVDVRRMVEILNAEFGCEMILVEGGPRIIGSLLREGLIDRYCVTVCPYLFGGERGEVINPIMGLGVSSMEAGRYRLTEFERDGDWIFLTYMR